jgi:hypothetical protein
VCARGLQDLADLGLGPHRTEEAGARADDGARLVAQDVVRERARGPVERVLERARQRGVVLGGGDEERVGLGDGVEELPDGLGRRGLEVLVEGGQAGEALPLHEVRSGRERVARRPEQPAVVGASAQAAGDAEDPHLD